MTRLLCRSDVFPAAPRCTYAVLLAATALAVLGCGGSEPTAPEVFAITVALASANLTVGQTTTATATATDKDGRPVALPSVAWTSSKPSVATVSAAGVVTAIDTGFTLITASADNRESLGQQLWVKPVPVASVEIAVPTGALTPRGTMQLTATAKDSAGHPIPGHHFYWWSDTTYIAGVASGTGLVTALNAGTTVIGVKELETNVAGHITLKVAAPTRPLGGLIGIGEDSVLQWGSQLYLSTVGYVDTASTGKDARIGVIRTAGSPIVGPVLRADFPQVSGITECPNGSVYFTDFSSGYSDVHLWSLDLATAFATNIGTLPLQGAAVADLACDVNNKILVATNFASFGYLYRVSGQNASTSLVAGWAVTLNGIAIGPDGRLWATISDPLATTSARNLLAIMDPTSFVLNASDSTQAWHVGTTSDLVFRGSRLLSLWGDLSEVNTKTGAITTIRKFSIP